MKATSRPRRWRDARSHSSRRRRSTRVNTRQRSTSGAGRRSWKSSVFGQPQCIPDALVAVVKQYLLDEVVYLMPYAVSAPEDTPMDAYKIKLDALLQKQDDSDPLDMIHEQFDSGVLKEEKQKNKQ